MNKGIKSLAAIVLGLAAVACSSPEKMAEQAENVTVKCNPAVLEVVAGKINAEVSVTYPDKYFHPKAILEVTPVIVYEGGEAKMAPYYFQGEKVKDNYETVPSTGATVTKKVSFNYVPGMEKCYLELRGVVKYGKKSTNIPSKKVADGANTTYMLVDKSGRVDLKADGYQEIIKQTAEGQILYTINSSNVRGSELKSKSVKDFQAALAEIQENSRKNITSTDVVAYASPDGGQKLNDKLSDSRSKSAEKAFAKVTKKNALDAPVNVQSIGQDWEGFKELVEQSNLQDKALVLNVLARISDPEQREQEIRNLSAAYKELAEDILPQLRYSKVTATVKNIGHTDDEILALVNSDSKALTLEELLYAANLVKENSKKVEILNIADKNFPQDLRAKNNIADIKYKEGKYDEAEKIWNEIIKKNPNMPEANLNLGLVALNNGDLNKAASYFGKAGTCAEYGEAMGTLLTNQGNYSAACDYFGKAKTNNAAVAQICANNLSAAKSTLEAVQDKNATTYYLLAIVGARTNNSDAVSTNLKKAVSMDGALKAKAANDIEFAKFASIVNGL